MTSCCFNYWTPPTAFAGSPLSHYVTAPPIFDLGSIASKKGGKYNSPYTLI